ncbi:TlpA family protein disulfide reductase [Sphingobacterium puteale]|nr:TlpA disulfide reductase family protein [Sphingobacterium puteale]
MNNFYKAGGELPITKRYPSSKQTRWKRSIAFLDKTMSVPIIQITILVILYLLVSMFSLSAQTPRKDSGADGLLTNAKTSQVVLPAAIEPVKDTTRIKPLQPGNKVPEAFWNAEHSFLVGNKAVKSALSKFRGKLLLLDFWEPYCYACLLKFPALDSLHAQLGELGNIVLVSSKQYRRGTAEYISQKLDEQGQRQKLRLDMDKIVQDDTLMDYFPHTYIPHYILIDSNGTVLALGSVEVFDTIAQIIKDEVVHNNKKQCR